MTSETLIGHELERIQLTAALGDAIDGTGSLVLLSGEAGTGKTRLAQDALADSEDATFVRGAATPAGSPFGPITAALRGYLRTNPEGLTSCGPLRPHLALLLPELGEARTTGDRATLFEAIRCAFAKYIRPSGRRIRIPAKVSSSGWSGDRGRKTSVPGWASRRHSGS